MPVLFNMQCSYIGDEVSEEIQDVSWMTAKQYIILANIKLVPHECKKIVVYI